MTFGMLKCMDRLKISFFYFCKHKAFQNIVSLFQIEPNGTFYLEYNTTVVGDCYEWLVFAYSFEIDDYFRITIMFIVAFSSVTKIRMVSSVIKGGSSNKEIGFHFEKIWIF